MDVSKFFILGLAGLLLVGCGQTGPLYPVAQESKPEHKYDQFLLQSSKPTTAPTTQKTTSASVVDSPVQSDHGVVLPYPFPKSSN